MKMERDKLISLVTSAQQGDQNAFNDLFNAFYNDFYYYALMLVEDEENALDVTQEAFVEIFRTIGNLREPVAFVSWAKKIVKHRCSRYFETAKKTDLLVYENEDENSSIFDNIVEDKAEFIPDEALDKEDFKNTIMSIVWKLPVEQRSAVMMYYFDEMSVKEIAEIEGVSEGTIKSRLNYARKAIKNSVEEYEKKHNIKLHAIPFFPFFKWIFEGAFEGLPTASAEVIAEGVSAATGTTIAVTTTTGVAATATTTATTAGAVGLGAKIAAMPIASKIIAGVVAAAIAIGGGTTAVLLSQKDNDVSTGANSQIDYSYVSDDMKSWSYNEALDRYHDWLTDFDMPYFNSVDEVSVDVAVRFGFGEWMGYYQGELETSNLVEEQKVLLKALFGREFDFSDLTGEYATYNEKKGTVIVNKDTVNIYNTESWRSNTSTPIDNGDGTYSIIICEYRNKVETLPEGIKDGEYTIDEENGGYFLLTHSGRLTIEKKGDFWVLKSYTKDNSQQVNNSSTETTTDEDTSSDDSNDNETTTSTSTNTQNEIYYQYMKSWNYTDAFTHYFSWLTGFDVPYFNSVDEISTDVAVRFGLSEWGYFADKSRNTMFVDQQTALLKAVFGREFDFNSLTGEFATYNSQEKSIKINDGTTNYDNDVLHGEKSEIIDNGDGTYSMTFRCYFIKVDTLPSDVEQGEYLVDEENGGYFLLSHSGKLTVEKKGDYWVVKSYTK